MRREQEAAARKSAGQKAIEAQQAANQRRYDSKAEATIQKFRKEHPELYRGK